jgi:hypothetical protein
MSRPCLLTTASNIYLSPRARIKVDAKRCFVVWVLIHMLPDSVFPASENVNTTNMF